MYQLFLNFRYLTVKHITIITSIKMKANLKVYALILLCYSPIPIKHYLPVVFLATVTLAMCMSLLGVLGFSEQAFIYGISDTKLNFGPILRLKSFSLLLNKDYKEIC